MIHGRLLIDPKAGEWVITTTPDVTMKLKRIFPRMEQSHALELRLKATPEIANDLEWILIKYPFAVEPAIEKHLTTQAKAFREKQALLEKIVTTPPNPSDFTLALPIRGYQSTAAQLHLAQGYLLLADEVGLGKSAAAIATLTDKRTLPVLIVVKAHLPVQWVLEVRKFIPGAVCHIIKQNKEYVLPPCDVYIISYSKLASWWGIMARRVKSVIYDEIQELRLPSSDKYRAAGFLNSQVPFRIGLSATPIHNYGGEIWNVMNLLQPDVLGSYAEFSREWGEGDLIKDPVALGHYMRKQNMMLRRTRKDVGRELPPVQRYVQQCDFDEDTYNRGMSAADALARTILSGTFTERGQSTRTFDMLIRQSTGIAKAPFVAEYVRMLVDAGEKVLLFGWHRGVYDVWRDRLKDLGIAFYTGTESPAQKDQATKDFISGKAKVLIMSLRSGAGLNGLQDVCSVCVYGELDWSPAVHHQCTGRLNRDGQKASVQAFFMVAAEGSDPAMAAVLGLKEAQATGIVDLGVTTAPSDEADPKRIRQLAIDYLKSKGLPVFQQEAPLEMVPA